MFKAYDTAKEAWTDALNYLSSNWHLLRERQIYISPRQGLVIMNVYSRDSDWSLDFNTYKGDSGLAKADVQSAFLYIKGYKEDELQFKANPSKDLAWAKCIAYASDFPRGCSESFGLKAPSTIWHATNIHKPVKFVLGPRLTNDLAKLGYLPTDVKSDTEAMAIVRAKKRKADEVHERFFH